MSLIAKFDSLRLLATKLEKKEEVPPELWAQSGVKVNCRLKDVQVEIQSLKKKVSALQKEQHKPDSDEEEEEDAKNKREGRQEKRGVEDKRKHGLDKKNLVAAAATGAFDLEREYA